VQNETVLVRELTERNVEVQAAAYKMEESPNDLGREGHEDGGFGEVAGQRGVTGAFGLARAPAGVISPTTTSMEAGCAWTATSYRHGETISTAFVESTINQVVSRRFVKKQQMNCTFHGAHLLLQTRTTVLNHEMDDEFRRWYPQFRTKAV